VLVVVLVKMITTWLAVVANVFVVSASWEPAKIARRQLRSVFRRVGGIVAGVFVGIKKVKGRFVLVL